MPEIRIGLFGGSFDPFHIGHKALIESFLKSGKLDELWVIPTYKPPHKVDLSITPFRNRLEMCRIGVQNLQGVSVTDIEQKLPTPSYTFQTLSQFKKMFPYYRFYLCIGGDQLLNFHQWMLYDAILYMSHLLVAERPGISFASIKKEIWEKAEFIEHQPLDVSSTKIRRLIKSGAIQHAPLSQDIKDYIVLNKLYK